MSDPARRPVILLSFANDREEVVGYLHCLADEARQVRRALDPAEREQLCEVVERPSCTADDVFRAFQDSRYRNRIAVWHFGGHANDFQLLLESSAGGAAPAEADGLAAFVARQQGLQAVFLNGCCTRRQAYGLHAAGVPAVIATVREIDDAEASEFAATFYRGLAGGAAVDTAYHEAVAALRTKPPREQAAVHEASTDDDLGTVAPDDVPWQLLLRPGDEEAGKWNLPNAVDNPLFGLPTPAPRDLPSCPYKYLDMYTREDADVFFGRGREIRELYERLTAPHGAPLLLLYGSSGVGKSSLLDAGLFPRLEGRCEVRYARRDARGLLDTLRTQVDAANSELSLLDAWRARERRTGRPLIAILDQVETVFTRPLPQCPDELSQFVGALQSTFGERGRRPLGKIVLSFRKEWLAELETQLSTCALPRSKMFLAPLDRRGVLEVVSGPTKSRRLQQQFGLTIEDGLPESVAETLLADRNAVVAPTLQILLTRMWESAVGETEQGPRFRHELFDRLRRDGIGLRDFLTRQINEIARRQPEAVRSGLLLDLLAVHTSSLGTAERRSIEELRRLYVQCGEASLTGLLQASQDGYLLTEATDVQSGGGKSTRLAHDTLAPLVRERCDKSDLPGQRARRILDNHVADWREGRTGIPLGDAALTVLEQGLAGTRALDDDERRLWEASRKERDERGRAVARRRTWAVAAAVAIGAVASLAVWEWRESARVRVANAKAHDELLTAQAQRLADAIGQNGGELHPTEIEALRELAGLSGDDRQVRVRFFEQALASDENARQLWRRVEYAVSSAVGAQDGVRAEVLEVAGRKFRDTRSDVVRYAAVTLILELEVADRRLALDATLTLADPARFDNLAASELSLVQERFGRALDRWNVEQPPELVTQLLEKLTPGRPIDDTIRLLESLRDSGLRLRSEHLTTLGRIVAIHFERTPHEFAALERLCRHLAEHCEGRSPAEVAPVMDAVWMQLERFRALRASSGPLVVGAALPLAPYSARNQKAECLRGLVELLRQRSIRQAAVNASKPPPEHHEIEELVAQVGRDVLEGGEPNRRSKLRFDPIAPELTSEEPGERKWHEAEVVLLLSLGEIPGRFDAEALVSMFTAKSPMEDDPTRPPIEPFAIDVWRRLADRLNSLQISEFLQRLDDPTSQVDVRHRTVGRLALLTVQLRDERAAEAAIRQICEDWETVARQESGGGEAESRALAAALQALAVAAQSPSLRPRVEAECQRLVETLNADSFKTRNFQSAEALVDVVRAVDSSTLNETLFARLGTLIDQKPQSFDRTIRITECLARQSLRWDEAVGKRRVDRLLAEPFRRIGNFHQLQWTAVAGVVACCEAEAGRKLLRELAAREGGWPVLWWELTPDVIARSYLAIYDGKLVDQRVRELTKDDWNMEVCGELLRVDVVSPVDAAHWARIEDRLLVNITNAAAKALEQTASESVDVLNELRRRGRTRDRNQVARGLLTRIQQADDFPLQREVSDSLSRLDGVTDAALLREFLDQPACVGHARRRVLAALEQ